MARLSEQQKLGRNIKRRRNALGLTQEKLGELTGFDRGYISGIERGVRNPAIKNIGKLAKALGISPSELLDQS
jgi:transcriptional regulator with XRE-family HTH domain